MLILSPRPGSVLRGLGLLCLVGLSVGRLRASGDDFAPETFGLESGGQIIDAPLEYFWAQELRLMAKKFLPKEKRVPREMVGESPLTEQIATERVSATQVPLYVPVTVEEKKRLAKQHHPLPGDAPFLTYQALDLMWKAAALLPDNSEELADVLNTAGNWVKGDYRGDDKAADKFFQAIERRVPMTEVGKEAGAKHWFVEHTGPWSVPAAPGE